MKKVVFKIVEEKKVNLIGNGKFSIGNGGVRLKVSVGSITADVVYLCSKIEDLNLEDVMKLIGPTNVDSLLYSNLSYIDYNEIYPKFDLCSEYYLDMGELVTIKKLTENDIEEYIDVFKRDVEEAVYEFGYDNVSISEILESDKYYIECDTEEGTIIYKDKFYVGKFISTDLIRELCSELSCFNSI